MIYYFIQLIAFQLLFLAMYNLLLKKETFFQWNRIYLLVSMGCSFIIPLIQLELPGRILPKKYVNAIPTITLPEIRLSAVSKPVSQMSEFNGIAIIFLLGTGISLWMFLRKLNRIHRIKKQSITENNKTYNKNTVPNSEMAFSFFKDVFIGDQIPVKDHAHILAHELVHVRQKHSWDLMFFELLRILFWFNPLVYVYQAKIAEIHEYIADEKTTTGNGKSQFERLLSNVFNVEHISFVNQFFNHSLIKKRIIMLQKTRSKKRRLLKYAMMVPLVAGMLTYTSCQKSTKKESAMHEMETLEKPYKEKDVSGVNEPATPVKTAHTPNENSTDENGIPFFRVDKVPVFPGCENSEDKQSCFTDKISEHIKANFQYPKEAYDKQIEGRIAVLFTIDEDGNVSKIKKRGPHPLLIAEAERLIRSLPKMKPGEHHNKPVKVLYSLPINFNLK